MANHTIQSEQDLNRVISGCAANDRRSQEVLYRHYFPTMERMVRRYTTDDDKIISILNNGFLKGFQNIEQYQKRGSFEGWLRRIIFHSVSDYMRKHSRDVKYLVFDQDIKDHGDAPDSRLYFDDLIQLIQSLPETNMKVFQLYAIEGFKHAEIAQELNINESTSRWYLGEARKQLKEKLMKQNKSYRDVG